MLKSLTKTTPLLLAALLAATTGFAQDYTRGQKKGFDQGLEMPASQTLAAHSYPARQEVRGSWDIQTHVSYILWQAVQDNMELGIQSNNNSIAVGKTIADSISTVKHADFDFRSGFKVGLGLNLDYDNWNVSSEYTWFHGKTGTTIPAEAGQVIYSTRPFTAISDPNVNAPSARQDWKLKMDFVDLSLSRSYYSGTRFTLNPFIGARGGWIRQRLNLVYPFTGESNGLTTSYTHTVSQGIGPRTGVNSNWLLGYGFRLAGKAAGDLLFTRYDYLSSSRVTTKIDDGFKVTYQQVSDKHSAVLRAHTDLELGLGWGSYFDNNNWYVDLSADYGFQMFWDQNMFRAYGLNFGQTKSPNGNLSIHGLTLTARVDY